ncbi:MAG: hypothetical protein IPJ66_09220 [Bacteroidetes bacterium]|nr:hypothetical protein [Bacteroidota bacterium]MBL0063426.1 hypothetical protein [Bacteroidota bacterium]MBL0140145.1 hypothetical protein [Bacteroidota bacterium]
MTSKKLNIHIPKLGILYWTLMTLATTIGEIVGNLISRNLGLGYSTGSILLISIYVFSIIAIALSRRENATVYWLLIVLGNIAGTNCADFITIEPLKLGTVWGSVLVMGILTLTLIIWKFVSPKSTVESGLNNKTFFLYWFAIIVSSTFGTTSGDLLSNDTPLGAGGGTILLTIILSVFALLNKYTNFSKEILYWVALVVMHPIGATIGNYISKPAGLNFGNIWTSIVLVIVFIALFITNQRRKVAL